MYNPDAVVVVASPMEMFWYNQMMSADMGIFGWVIVMGVIFTLYAILLDKYKWKCGKTCSNLIKNHFIKISLALTIATSLAVVKSGLLNWILVHLF